MRISSYQHPHGVSILARAQVPVLSIQSILRPRRQQEHELPPAQNQLLSLSVLSRRTRAPELLINELQRLSLISSKLSKKGLNGHNKAV